ncbi:MAG: polysaccharide deacetylase family protein [Clostridia bacterium]
MKCKVKFFCTLTISLVFICLTTAFAFSNILNCNVANATKQNTVTLPIIMYHSVLNSKTGTYIVSCKQLQCDLDRFKVDGYQTVLPSQVIDYVYFGGTLPQKPILITFDDGYYNNFYYAKDIFVKNNAKAVINVVGKFSERTVDSNERLNPHYSHLTWQNMQTMAGSGNFEFGNHTYDMHRQSPRFGIGQMKGESAEQYKNILIADTLKLKSKLQSLGISTEVYAYPFGKYNDTARETLKSLGYKMLFTCNEGINIITCGKPKCLECLFRINRSGAYSTDDLMRQITHPQKIGGVAISKQK